MTSEVRLKQKCNKLIDCAQEKENELKELRKILYDRLEQKALLEQRLNKSNSGAEHYPQYSIVPVIEKEEFHYNPDWVPIVQTPGEIAFPFEEREIRSITEQELFDIFVEFGKQLNNRLDDEIDRKIEDRIRDISGNDKHQVDKGYLGLSDEVAIIYEHGNFYEIIRKLGYIVMLIFILAIMALAVISVATLV